VTGAASGLGRAEAIALASRGARVLAADIADPAAVVEEVIANGGEASGTVADVGEPGQAASLAGRAIDCYGDLHIVVNNAGIVRDAMSFNLSLEDWERVIAVNLTGTFMICRAAATAWRAMYHAGSRTRRAIINTSSESGLNGNVGQVNYAAAKAGVAALTLTLAAELDQYGVRVNAIAPRARTAMSQGAFGELSAPGEHDPFDPAHVAGLVAWLASEAAGEITGQVMVVHGAGVEVLRGWSGERMVTRNAPWSDPDLVGLKASLFGQSDGRHLPGPVRDLFGAADTPHGVSR
jgi:3-oxoacyl-[acyl-carrier protein] reductase